MDLIDEDVGDGLQRLPRLAREHQVEGFGRGDQDVRRASDEALALGGGGVAGADGDGERFEGRAQHLGSRQDLGERTLEVAGDVVVEGLERGDIQDADASGGAGVPPEVIEAGEEGGEGLAGTGRGKEERVLTRRDRGPAEALGGRGVAEAIAEPGRDREQKTVEDVAGLGFQSGSTSAAVTQDQPGEFSQSGAVGGNSNRVRMDGSCQIVDCGIRSDPVSGSSTTGREARFLLLVKSLPDEAGTRRRHVGDACESPAGRRGDACYCDGQPIANSGIAIICKGILPILKFVRHPEGAAGGDVSSGDWVGRATELPRS